MYRIKIKNKKSPINLLKKLSYQEFNVLVQMASLSDSSGRVIMDEEEYRIDKATYKFLIKNKFLVEAPPDSINKYIVIPLLSDLFKEFGVN